jgi:hypothetical protein
MNDWFKLLSRQLANTRPGNYTPAPIIPVEPKK